MMFRRKFTEIEIDEIKESLNRNASIQEIADSLGRSKYTVQKKMWSLGLKKQNLLERKMKREEIKEQFQKKKKKLKKEKVSEANDLSRINPCLTGEWQEVLSLTGSKIGEWKGQRVLLMNGRPSSVQEIRAQYSLLLKSYFAPSNAAVPAVSKPYLAKN